MPPEPKKLGTIGTGSVVRRFVEGLNAVGQDKSRVKLAAVADVKSPEDVAPLTSADYEYYQLPPLWAGNPDPGAVPKEMREFLEKVDAVYVASPNNLHQGYILCAVNAGKDVLCTKPLTESLATAQLLKDELETKGVSSGRDEPGQPKFMYEDHYLYQGISIKLFDELIPENNPFDERELGRIQSVNGFFMEKRGASRIEAARAGWLFTPAISGGGVWIDIGIHLVAILHKLGARFKIISAHPRIDAGFAAEMKMTVEASLDPDDNVEKPPITWAETPVNLVAEKEAEQARKEINFHFEKGLISLDLIKGTIVRSSGGQNRDVLSQEQSDPYQNVADIFSELITGQDDRRLASISDAVKDLAVVDEVYHKAGLK